MATHSNVLICRIPRTEEFGWLWSTVAQYKSLSRVQLFATPWTIAHQAPLYMEFSRQEYWSGLPFPPLGDLPNPGIKPTSLISAALAGGLFTIESPGESSGLISQQVA